MKAHELTAVEQQDLDHAYGYKAPTPEQVERYASINAAAKHFEKTVLENCPSSADRTFATRQIRDARMTANRSIALHIAKAVVLALAWLGCKSALAQTTAEVRLCAAKYAAAIVKVDSIASEVQETPSSREMFSRLSETFHDARELVEEYPSASYPSLCSEAALALMRAPLDRMRAQGFAREPAEIVTERVRLARDALGRAAEVGREPLKPR